MNLRKIHGLRMIGFVAAHAKFRRVQLLWHSACWVLRVIGLWSVAGLASHPRVTAPLLHIQDVGMAGLTDFMARIGNRPGRDFVQRIAPVVAVLAKTLGHKETPQDEK